MCGIAGFLDIKGRTARSTAIVRAMADSLLHRGPDAGDAWTDEEAGIAFGHRRLSILDLSPAGAQPMTSANGRWVITYNGEVYNFPDLKADLEAAGVVFRGHSDTEVIVEGLAHWGVEATLGRLVGMFALAAWDRHDRRLWLARDHLGIKPLYWAELGGSLLFASEPKAFRPHPAWNPSLNRDAVASYMRFGYIPGTTSIWQEVQKLSPGTLLSVDAAGRRKISAFWTLENAVSAGQREPWSDSPEAAVDALNDLLGDAVKRQMVSDVPLGAFLSGGIDSSTVVALMQQHSTRPVKTFSIGFHEDGFNEAQHASLVAKHLGTDHTELYVQSDQALAVVPHLSEWYDEPFADSSQIPTYLVSKLARADVTVALSGDGGDEVFAGYSRYTYLRQLWRMTGALPRPLRAILSGGVRGVPNSVWDLVGAMLPGGLRKTHLGAKLNRLVDGWNQGPQDLYLRLLSHWVEPEAVVPGTREIPPLATDGTLAARLPDILARMQYIDTLTYLPDDILTKVDRSAMAVSLETRVPLLDHRVVEFAWRFGTDVKERDGAGKWLLRQVLYRYVPRTLVDRPKMGFGVPIDSWLRGPLKDWAWSHLAPDAISRHGLLDPEPVKALWDRHQSGVENNQYPLWTAVMLQDWLAREASYRRAPASARA